MSGTTKSKKMLEGQMANAGFFSAREVSQRWDCSPSTVARIAAKAGIKRFVLGHGKNAMVRFLRHDIEAYEASRAS